MVEEKHFSTYVDTEVPNLSSKTVAITGTTSGTGFWAVIACIRKNAKTVYVLNRDSERVQESLKRLNAEKEKVGSETEVVQINCDLMSLKAVKGAADELNTKASEGLDVLILNAGIAAWNDDRTDDGYEVQMQVNVISHFLLSHLLIETLKKKENPRIISHSSQARYSAVFDALYYVKSDPNSLGGNSLEQRLTRYSQTKLANCLFTLAMKENFPGMIFATAEPGYSETDIFQNSANASKKNTQPGNETMMQSIKGAFYGLVFALASRQTASDGTMPLLAASFGEISNGDLIIPRNENTGLPWKAISDGKPQWTFYKESNILDSKMAQRMYTLLKVACKEYLP